MAILKTALTEGEARYHAMEQTPGGRLKIVRKWEYIDATAADDLIVAAPPTVTGPYVDGQQYTGTYYVKTEVGEFNDERWVTIYQTLTSDTGILKHRSLANTLRDDVTVIYDQYSAYVNTPADSQGNVYQSQNSINDDGTYDAKLVYQVSNAKTTNFTSVDAYFKNVESIMYDNSRTAIDAPEAGVGGVYRVAGQRQNDDGTYSGRLDYVVGSNDGTYVFESLNSDMRDDVTRIYKDALGPATAPASTTGRIYTANNSITDDGTYNAQVEYQQSTPKTAKYTKTQARLLDRVGTLHENQLTVTEAPADEVGKIYDTSNRLNQDGTYSGESTYTGSNPAEYSFASRVSTLVNDASRIYKNQVTGIQGGAASVGTTYAVNQNVNQDGTYDGQVQRSVRTPAQHEFSSRDSILRNDTSTIYRGAASPIAGGGAPALPGFIYQTTQQPQDDGTYNGELTYTYNRPDYIYQTFAGRRGTSWMYAFKNVDDPNDYAALLSAGRQNSISIGENEDGSYNGVVQSAPTLGSISFWSNRERDFYSYKFRDYPGSLTQRLGRVDYWKIYTTFSTSSTTAADDCEGSYFTSVRKSGPVWQAQYWRPVALSTAWELIA